MSGVDLNSVAVPLRFGELFGRQTETDVEIGAGKGRFLLELAAANPQRDYLAVERAAKYCTLCCARAAKRGLTNVHLIRTTAEDLFERLLPPESVSNLYVLFPDPWPKKRHHKRRLLKPEVMPSIVRCLRGSGRVLIKTDHAAYAEVIREVLDGAAGMRPIDPAAAFHGLPVTGFEHKYVDQGREIFSFAVERTG